MGIERERDSLRLFGWIWCAHSNAAVTAGSLWNRSYVKYITWSTDSFIFSMQLWAKLPIRRLAVTRLLCGPWPRCQQLVSRLLLRNSSESGRWDPSPWPSLPFFQSVGIIQVPVFTSFYLSVLGIFLSTYRPSNLRKLNILLLIIHTIALHMLVLVVDGLVAIHCPLAQPCMEPHGHYKAMWPSLQWLITTPQRPITIHQLLVLPSLFFLKQMEVQLNEISCS